MAFFQNGGNSNRPSDVLELKARSQNHRYPANPEKRACPEYFFPLEKNDSAIPIPRTPSI
jgi:hypothetical protein